MNKYIPHIVVYPEDDANRQMAVGFRLHPSLKTHLISIQHPCGGWRETLDVLQNDDILKLQKYINRHIVLLLDFDNKFSERMKIFEKNCPRDAKDRVFILGTLTEPEKLKNDCNKSFEKIGKTLAAECADNIFSRNPESIWNHELLKHNDPERKRLAELAGKILFP